MGRSLVVTLITALAIRLLVDGSEDRGIEVWLAAERPPSHAAETLLGPGSRPIKLTIFDKTSHANWKVPWHQDLTITVQERQDVPGFGPWTIKDGVPHVQPPVPFSNR